MDKLKIDIKDKIKIFYTLGFLYNVSITVFSSISYIFLVKSGFSYEQIGIYMSFFWITNMISEIPTGIIVDVYKHKLTLLGANFTRMIGILMLAFNGTNMTILLPLNGLLSTKFGILNSWKIFIALSLIAILVISMWKEPKYD